MPRVYRDPNRAPYQEPAWKQRSMTAEQTIAGYRSGEDAPVPAGHIEVSKIWKNSWWTRVPGLHSHMDGEGEIPQEPSPMRAMSYAFAMSHVSRKRIIEVGVAHFRQTPEGRSAREESVRRLRIKGITMPLEPPSQPVDQELAEFLEQHGEGAYNAAMQMAEDLTMLGQHKAYQGLWQGKDSSVALAAEILEQAAAGLEHRIAGVEPPKSLPLPGWTPPWRSVTQGEWEKTPAQAVTGRLDWIDAELLEMEEWDTESGNDPLVGEEQAIAAIPGLEQVTLQVVQKAICGDDLLQMLVQEEGYAADRLMDRLSPEQKQQLQRMVTEATSAEKERIKAELRRKQTP